MARIPAKYLRAGVSAGDVNAQTFPATFTPVNYTPAEVASEGTDKVSAHLNGIDNALTGIASTPGDIGQTTWSGLADNTADQTITGLTFANGVVRSFEAQMSIVIDATSDLFTEVSLKGIQRASDWVISADFVGDVVPGISFNMTSAGQVRMSIGSVAGFASGDVKFRAKVTSV